MQREADQETNSAPPAAESRAEEHAPQSADQHPADGSTVNRAEEMVDRMAAKVASWTSSLGRSLLRLGARAREEAEDMWAEAQNIRRGGQP